MKNTKRFDDSFLPSQAGASRPITRRALFSVCAGLGLALIGAPVSAFADLDDTEAALAEAQAQLASVQSQLDSIAAEYEQLSLIHEETLSQIEAKQSEIDQTQAQIDETQAQIDQTQAQIDAKQQELEDDQEILSKRVASAYKAGGSGLLDVLLSSASFDELVSNIYYLDKISEADRKIIEDVKRVKAELEEAKALLEAQKAQLEEQRSQLEAQRAELEQLSAVQQGQLQDMLNKQLEVQNIIAGLDQNVRDLMAQRDEELAAAAAAAAAAEQARRAAATGSVANIPTGGGQSISSASGTQQAVVEACHVTPSPGVGWCAAWVSQVYSNAGLGYPGGDACDMYANWCHSSDKGYLQVGMIIAVSTHAHTSAGRIYGHVGVYVGNGMVMDNIGYIRTISVDDWISYYSTTVTPRWGWIYGNALG